MSKTATAPQTPAPKAKGGRMVKLIILVVVIICSVGAGLLAPRLMAGNLFGGDGAKPAETPRAKIPFGEVVVNLNVERQTRYLRVKVVVVVEGKHEKEMTEKITTKKVEMRSWLISHLRDKSIDDLAGSTGFNRLRREVLEEFNELVDKPGSDMIQEILLEEFVIQ